MRSVHLYFTKLFGCLIVDGGIPIETDPFAAAIMSGQPHSQLYLAFGHLAMPLETVGGSDIAMAQADGKVAFATWLYNVGDLAVRVMYALPGEQRQGLEAAWHPSMGVNRLPFTRF